MIPVQGFLVRPFIDQEQVFGSVCRIEIIVADAALDGADLRGDAAAFHLFHVFAGVPVFSGITDVDGYLRIAMIGNQSEQSADNQKQKTFFHDIISIELDFFTKIVLYFTLQVGFLNNWTGCQAERFLSRFLTSPT